MKITQLFQQKNPVLSFEVFPPKPDLPFAPVLEAIEELAVLEPDFISVTYGAAGNNGKRTAEIAMHLKQVKKIEALAHLTCIAGNSAQTAAILQELKACGVENILALRGDPPADMPVKPTGVFAKDLVTQIKHTGDFCVAAAVYPEGHPECPDRDLELSYLQDKIAAGVDFLITQIFFDNTFFYDLLGKLDRQGIGMPVCAGIMPVFSQKQIERICGLCGATIPRALRRLMDKYGNSQPDMQKAGLEYAAAQIDDLLAHKVRGLHLYTMNRPVLAKAMTADTKLRQVTGQ